MDIRGLNWALDSVLSTAITLTCVLGTFLVSRYALLVAFR